MGKQSKPAPKNSFKYGMPLYGAAWPEGDTIFVAGGGGSGIQNRLVFARYKSKDKELQDQLGAFNFGSDCPTRTLLHPTGKYLLVALSSKKMRCFQIQTRGTRLPRVTEVTGDLQNRLQHFSSRPEVKSLAFSSSGKLLAVGYVDGEVEVLQWPSIQPTELHLSGETALKDDIRDVDFSPVHRDDVLAISSLDGNCELWQISPPTCLARVTPPASIGRTRLERCRFARNGQNVLYTTANGPLGTHVMAWEEAGGKGQLRLQKATLATKNTAVAFDVSPDGTTLALATNEGDVVALSSTSLQLVKVARKAHMVFPTGLTFAQDSQHVLSISMDASACVTDVRPPPPATPWLAIFSVLILIMAVAIGLAVQVSDGSPPHPAFQQILRMAMKTTAENSSVGAPVPAPAAASVAGGYADAASVPFPHLLQQPAPASNPAATI